MEPHTITAQRCDRKKFHSMLYLLAMKKIELFIPDKQICHILKEADHLNLVCIAEVKSELWVKGVVCFEIWR